MFTEQQEKLREKDDVKIVKRWVVSELTYGADSRQRAINPDYHPPVCLREDGAFCDVAGRLLRPEAIPPYILEDCEVPEHTPDQKRTMTLAEAMQIADSPTGKTHDESAYLDEDEQAAPVEAAPKKTPATRAKKSTKKGTTKRTGTSRSY